MTDHDNNGFEAPVSRSTSEQIGAMLLELRSMDGFITDSRSITTQDIPGVEAIFVGESEQGQYAIVCNTTAIDGPFMRDVYVTDGGLVRLYRVIIELTEGELADLTELHECLVEWKRQLGELDEAERGEQTARLQEDMRSFDETLRSIKDITTLQRVGDIDTEQARQLQSAISIRYDLYQSDDPKVIAFETHYAKCAQALIDYQAFVMDVNERLEIVAGDIVAGEGDQLSRLEMPLTEAKAWNLLAVLDRVAATNT